MRNYSSKCARLEIFLPCLSKCPFGVDIVAIKLALNKIPCFYSATLRFNGNTYAMKVHPQRGRGPFIKFKDNEDYKTFFINNGSKSMSTTAEDRVQFR